MTSRSALLPAAVVVALVAGCIAALVVASVKPAEAAFPGDNGSIAFAGIEVVDEPGTGAVYHWGLYRMGPDGNGVKRLAEAADVTGVSSLDYSADGRKLVWSSDPCYDGSLCGTLYVANADGTDPHPLPATLPGVHYSWPDNYFFPSLFPSGRKIVFSARPDGRETITRASLFVVSLDKNGNPTGPATRWTDSGSDAFDWGAEVSPDGSKIAFVSDRDEEGDNGGDGEIYVMDANEPEGPGSPLVQLTDNPITDMDPDWSPDGKRIVYESLRSGSSRDIVVMNADGTSKKNLTRNPADERSPAFSPNGRWIAFSRATSDGRWELWKMRADGTGQVRLTEGFRLAHYPNWRPRP